MKKFISKNTKSINILLLLIAISFLGFIAYKLYLAPVKGIEAKSIYLLKEYGYIILFAWSILEGELGLIMAGIMVRLKEMDLYLAILIAGIGGFAGDQIYFFIGRNNKDYVRKKAAKHNEKFEKAHYLLEKYGWPIIFLQRYMYGLRTVIPISIGLTHYSAKKYAIINLISGIIWAAITITLAYIFGEELIKILNTIKENLHIIIPSGLTLLFIFLFYIKVLKKKN